MFCDQFSDSAPSYLRHRPSYPDDLFVYLASLVNVNELAWDCATGNGQAALQLAPYFRSIVAVDASPEQLALAPPHEQIVYVVSLEKRTALPNCSVDLVTVASAIHWLDLPSFYAEVRRVVKPDGIFATWGYKRPRVTPEVDAAVCRLDEKVLRDFWLPETRLAAEGYRGMRLPFAEIDAPPFSMVHEWNLDQLMGFLRTWSASLRYHRQTGLDPIDEIRDQLASAWGEFHIERPVTWDLHLRVGRVTARRASCGS
jgi:SAM-dependent methyltransferase